MTPKGPINVVGNAQSLFDKTYGSLIDQHTTIRFNYIADLVPEIQGTRWDYMATSNPREIRRWNGEDELPFKAYFFTTWAETEKKYIKARKPEFMSVPLYEIPDEIWMEAQRETKKRPSSGIMVLYTLYKLGINDVNIFGFDWKNTPTYYNADNPTKESGESKMHDYEDERNIALRLIDEMNWTLYE